MLTKNEITSLTLSPTKKDFVQIWNELLEVASKLSERWDPTSTNESDPGIVLLKALTGIADKLNYNIDKNTLEAFMPTAAQEDSMRKLCEMLGYNIKYYQSACTDVTIKYYNSAPEADEAQIMQSQNGLSIPKFTVITNNDQDISYFTTNESAVNISAKSPKITLSCMEGQLVKCESINDNNVITSNQISETNKFYFPETQIAENGIFVYNVIGDNSLGLVDGTPWKSVDNLNIQPRGSRVFKFGYDSYSSRPYIEFPEDYSELFNEGLFIYYARTSGINGNISPKTLTKIELPSTGDWSKVSTESFSVENIFSATSGSNIETIKQAYNNFKKTIGTFETLVTCRDYMNKIYSITVQGKPIVSNILVTDIRNDLNSAITICSCDGAGIYYKERPVIDTTAESTEVRVRNNRPYYGISDNYNNKQWYIDLGGSAVALGDLVNIMPVFTPAGGFMYDIEGTVEESTDGFWVISQTDQGVTKTFKTCFPVSSTQAVVENPRISHFDLVLYPFKTYNQIKNDLTGIVSNVRKVYDSSFDYTASKEIKDTITGIIEDETKTIAHEFITPKPGDIVSINNYLRLNAHVATNFKITEEEGNTIKQRIKIALANAFNMRELDFGEEIPFESIVEVIEKADPKIKMVSLNEPALYTTFSVYAGTDASGNAKLAEYAVASSGFTDEDAKATGRFETTPEGVFLTFDTKQAREHYNRLAVRNLFAGRIPLFNYNNTFNTDFSECAYQVTKEVNSEETDYKDISDKFNVIAPGQQYAVYTDDTGTIYTKQEDTYKKTYIPDDIKYSVVTSVNDMPIVKLATECKLLIDKETASVEDVVLAEGEHIRFRAPNFTTIKTYPAYVNYHLSLNKELRAEARSASATSLFDLLDADRDRWEATTSTKTAGKDIRWQKVLNYFENVDATKQTTYKKKVTWLKKVSGYTSTSINANEIENQIKNGKITIEIENNLEKEPEYNINTLMAESGCVKLKNLKARIEWDVPDGEVGPGGSPNVDIELDITNPFITDLSVFTTLQSSIDDKLIDYISLSTGGTLPAHDWKIIFEFEGVPFNAASLLEWEAFIKSDETLLDFVPKQELGTIFYRLGDEGYEPGSHVLQSTQKLLKFGSRYFGLLPDIALRGIYLVEDLGKDADPNILKNGTEYTLLDGEFLYIEYTPSSTTEDGTTQDLPPVKEIHGAGTIIRPSGFDIGIRDTDTLRDSAHKTVTFDIDGASREIEMHRFAANEQVEIRDIAEVTLSSDSFKNSYVYVYKNFNDCAELEQKATFDKEGNRTNGNYTLKDGECIWYTDVNKTDYAYFTSGTVVVLEGNLVLPRCEPVDLSTILEAGMHEIPWKPLKFDSYVGDAITFKEYQYITLSAKDTLKTLELADINKTELTDTWEWCSDAKYILASNSDDPNPIRLPEINVPGLKGNGWQVSSILSLGVSSDSAQALRKLEGKLETSIKLIGGSTGGSTTTENDSYKIIPSEGFGDSSNKLYFKTNLDCQGVGNTINVENVVYNPDSIKSFELKFFAKDEPVIVDTAPNKVVPFDADYDINDWPASTIEFESAKGVIRKGYSDVWNSVDLTEISVASAEGNPDRALRLPTNILPNTFGVFCIYLDYHTGDTTGITPKTWIEVFPGFNPNDLTLVNSTNTQWESAKNPGEADKLLLHPGINCIRVNKTTKLFVKTSNVSRGTLFFDEIRLVDNVYKYTNATGATETIKTQGLNLKQLGYLSTDVNEDSLLTSRRDFFVKKALTDVDVCEQQEKDNFKSTYKTLNSQVEKVEELVKVEEGIEKDLGNLSQQSEQTLTDLYSLYTELQESIETKEKLQEALSDNKTFDDQAQQLVDILNDLSSVNGLEWQQLRADLENLINETRSEAKNKLSKSDIILNCRLTTDRPQIVLPALKSAVRTKFDRDFYIQLEEIIDEALRTFNFDGQADFLSLLTEFQNTIKTNIPADRTELILLVSKLANSVAQTKNLETLFDNAITSAISADYRTLETLLSQIVSFIENGNEEFLIAELSAAVNDTTNTKLKTLVADLQSFYNNPPVSPAYVKKVRDILEDVREVIGSGETEYEKRIVSALLEAKTSFVFKPQYSNSQLPADTILYDISTILAGADQNSEIEKSIGNLLDLLMVNKKGNLQHIYDRIMNFYIVYSQNTSDLRGCFDEKILEDEVFTLPLKFNDNTTLDKYLEEAILEIWPEAYMLPMLYEKLEDTRGFYTSLIESLSASKQANIGTFEDHYSDTYETDWLKATIDKDAYLAIEARANALFDKEKQKTGIAAIINNISKATPYSAALTKAIGEYTDYIKELNNNQSTKKSNSVLSSLIDELSTAITSTDGTVSVAEKQLLIAALNKELNHILGLEKSLQGIVESMLWPEIKKLQDKVTNEEIDEDFFSKLLKRVGDIKVRLSMHLSDPKDSNVVSQLHNNFESEVLDPDDTYLENMQLSEEEIKKALLKDFDSSTGGLKDTKGNLFKESCIPKSITDVVKSLIESQKILDECNSFKNTDLNTADLAALKDSITSTQLLDILEALEANIEGTEVSEGTQEAIIIGQLERQLLAEIQATDIYREFYYNAPIEPSLAIDFNESDAKLNTLMNPLTNYDINNVNNSFVISKIDIDYIDRGVQIARSSRLN